MASLIAFPERLPPPVLHGVASGRARRVPRLHALGVALAGFGALLLVSLALFGNGGAAASTTGTIVVVKSTIGGDATFDFFGTGGLGAFTLTTSGGTDTTTFINLTPGTYELTETALVGWDLTELACDEIDGPPTDLGTLTATLGLDAGEVVTCTFTNTSINAVSAANSSVTATTPHVADGVDAATVTIVLVDGTGSPVTGLLDADFTIGLNGSALAGTVAETGTPGTYEVTVTDPAAETVTVSVTAGGVYLADEAPVVFVAGPVDGGVSTLFATSPHTADGVDIATVTILLMDANGNAVTGLLDADFAIGLTGSASAGTVSETGTPGTYEVLVTDPVAETVTVTVTADGVALLDDAAILFVFGPVSAANSTVTATALHVADGVDVATVTIVLVDATGNAVTALLDAEFIIDLSGSAVPGTVVETGTPGTYEVTVTDIVAEAVTVTVTADGVLLLDDAAILFVAGPVSAANSTVTVTTPHVADGVDAATATVVLVDANGNAVTGLLDADFLVGLTGSAGAGTVAETGTPGTYEVTVTDTDVETVTIIVTADGVLLADDAPVAFVAGPVDPGTAGDGAVEATTPHTADGVDAATVTIVLVDASGHAVTGLLDADFTIGLTGSANAGAVAETGTPGTYLVQVTNSVAETVTVTVTADGVLLADDAEIVFVPGPVSAANATVTATTPHVADGIDAATVTIVLTDANGNAVTGLLDADFAIGLTGAAAAGTVAETGTPGTYEVTVTDLGVETATVTVTADGVTVLDDATIVFVTGPVSAANSTVSATTPHVADGVDTATVTIVLMDANSHPVTGLPDGAFAIGVTGNASAGTVTETGTPGTYAVTVIDTTAEAATVTVTADGVLLLDDATILFVPGAVSAANSTVTATTPHIADGADAATITVVLVDANGNAVAGLLNADFAIGLAGSGLAGTVAETGTPGTYAVTVTDTVAETVTATVTADGVLLLDDAGIVFAAGAVSAASSTVTATTPHTADGIDASTVTIVLLDGTGNAVTGLLNADFAIGLTGGAVAGTVAETGTPGTYAVTVTDTVAETVTVTVTADGVLLADDATIVFVVGPVSAANSTVTATTPHVADGVEAATVTIVLVDATGNAVTGLLDADFIIGLTGNATPGTVAETGTPGTYTVQVVDATAEAVTVTVTADGVPLTDDAAIVFVPGTVSPANSTVTATTPHLANGVDAATVTIVLVDGAGNPVTGLADAAFAIGLTGSGAAGAVAETGTPGTYNVQVTDSVAQTVTVTVTADGVLLVDEPAILFVPGPASAASSSVTATTPHTADGIDAATVTIVLVDGTGNAVTGFVDADFAIGLTGGASAGAVAETGTPGTYTVQVTDMVAETVTVTVTADGVLLTDTAAIVFVAGPVSAANSTVTATTPHIADGVDAATVTIVLVDANGNAVTGLLDAAFAIGLSGSGVAGTVAETGTPGTYAVTVTDSVAETVTVTVTADGEALADDADIVFVVGAVSTANSTVTATTPHVADGVDAATVTIVLVDGAANPVTGLVNADFAIGLTGSGAAGTVAETGTPGTYEVMVTDIVAETVTVTVTANGVLLTDTAATVFVAGPVSAANSTVSATTPHIADGIDDATVTILVKDANGNPVTGLLNADFVVGLTGSAGGGTVAETGTPGTYAVQVTDAIVETVTVTVTADGVALIDDAAIVFVVGAVSAANSTVTATTPHVADGVDAATVTIVLVDGAGNPVTGLGTAAFLVGLTGSAGAGTVTETGTPGTYAVTITDAVAQTVTVTVTADGVLLIDGAAIVFVAGPVSAASSTVTATTPHVADGVDAATVTIVLVDGTGNPVTGLANADFAIGLTGSALAGTVAESGTPGTYAVTVTDTVVETITVTVTADAVLLGDDATVLFGAGTVSAANSTVTATTPHVADGVDAATVTIVLVDGDANPVTGLADAAFAIGLTGSAVAGTVVETGTPGTYEVTVTDTVAETVTVTVNADGILLVADAAIVFGVGPVSPGSSTVTATTPHLPDGIDAAIVTIVLVDGTGNAVIGLGDADFAIGLTGSALAGTVTETGTPGTYEVAVTDAVAETVTVTVTAALVLLADDATILFASGPDAATVIARTRGIIQDFAANRAGVLVEVGPALTHFNDRFNRTATAGATTLPVLAYQAVTGGAIDFEGMLLGPQQRLAVWIEGTFARYRLGAPGALIGGQVMQLQGGIDYLLGDRLILGLAMEADDARERSMDLGYAIGGIGWMVGPYAAIRVADTVVFDAKFMWGRSWNDIQPFLTYTDTFMTTRWVASARIGGETVVGPFLFRPEVSLMYFNEIMEGYFDANGFPIPRQTVAVGRLTFGPEVAMPMTAANGWTVQPSLALRGIWNFTTPDLSARLEGGLQIAVPGGPSLQVQGTYGGLFLPDNRSWSVKANLSIPLP